MKVVFQREILEYLWQLKMKKIIGFSAYDATGKGFFGPVGVSESARGKGVGRELTIYSLNALKNDGYAYAVIGGAQNAAGFYKKFLPIEKISSSIQNSIYNRKI
ncbi:GNAT family N-acetyltransferase [Dolosigranulum pigrum]|nr:GNAT family N-acetyltransferase [Dolosigranulum pigrum]